MTWAGLLASGRGKYSLRLMVEGWPDEWVTDQRITHSGNADGRRICAGLQYDGIKITEKLSMRDCWSTAGGIAFKIKPSQRSEDTIESFTKTAVPVGYLADDSGIPGLSDTSTHITLDTGITLPSGHYHVGTECFSTAGSNTIVRGKWNTVAQKHYISRAEITTMIAPVYSTPPSMQGRRCFLYVYGEGDSFSGDGTLLWRGVVATPPKLDTNGIDWTIQCDNIMKVLEQSVAAAEDLVYQPRGIYHSASCPVSFVFILQKGTAASYASKMYQLVGFYETQQDFVDAMNVELATLSVDIGTDYIASFSYAEIGGPPKLIMVVASPVGSGYSMSEVVLRSALEGDIVEQSSKAAGFTGGNVLSWTVGQGSFAGFASLSAGWTLVEYFGDASQKFVNVDTPQDSTPPYTYPLPAVRGCVGSPDRRTEVGTGPIVTDGTFAVPQYANYPDVSSFFPPDRVYLNTVDGLSVDDVLVVKNDDKMVPIQITAVDTTDRFISVTIMSSDKNIYLSNNSQLIPLRVFVTNTNLSQFIIELALQAVNANDGDTPYVTSNDVDTSALAFAFLFTPLAAFWRHRNYVFFKPTPIKTIIQEELKALGWMAILSSDGKTTFRQLPVVANNTPSDASLTEADILMPAGKMAGSWVSWEAQPDGIVNIINARFGYRPLEDDWDPKYDFSIRQIDSIAEHKSNGRGQVDCAPRSSAASLTAYGKDGTNLTVLSDTGDGVPITGAQVAEWMSNYLSVLSMDYAVVTVSVTFRYFNAIIGTVLDITHPHIPNGQGTRGMVSRKCIVIGREWNLDPKQQAMGKLTLYFPRETSGGYSPSGRITGQSNLGGNNWRLTFSPVNGFNIAWSTAGGGDVVSQFAVGELIQVEQTNALSPTIVIGTVSAVSPSGHTIDVALGATWTPSTITWNLVYTNNSLGLLTARQKTFTIVADGSRQEQDGTYASLYL